MRCIYDGRGVGNHVTAAPIKDNGEEQEAQVHAVMNADGGIGGRQPKAVAQRVVELIPTVPLYLPGSLSSPIASTRISANHHHLNQFTPPSTPEAMRQSYTWR